ncbi:hypothetical protein [Tropicibacter oceani]|uniref:Uncharacterized protein n=1 Tax=Tropicibacter oceani TaxID=3058420 RepID=A0ABY8QH72_9RHOB|nr:hypothetical protein [Tropicibacter oceani]WGW03997.1 hypothetical protein QF118_00220 [Tropicibacter oceani]
MFAYLEDWKPPAEVPSVPEIPARTERTPAQVAASFVAASKISTREIKAVLRDSYPDLTERSGHLRDLIQQELSMHAMIACPNQGPARDEYIRKREFLRTLSAGILSLSEDIPALSEVEISDGDTKRLKTRLIEVARLVDDSVAYLDGDTGTYGGLYKIGLIAGVGGLLSLFGMPLATGSAIAGGVLGAQTVRVHLSRDT